MKPFTKMAALQVFAQLASGEFSTIQSIKRGTLEKVTILRWGFTNDGDFTLIEVDAAKHLKGLKVREQINHIQTEWDKLVPSLPRFTFGTLQKIAEIIESLRDIEDEEQIEDKDNENE